MSWDKVLSVIAKFLGLILPLITPELREMLVDFLKKFHEKALKTENPWDDYLTNFLMTIFDVKE